MFKKIVVPHQLTELSQRALDWAVNLAKGHGATVHLLYIVGSGMGDFDPVLQKHQGTRAERAAAALEEVKEKLSVAAETHVIEASDVGGAIVSYAKEIDADLIVIATHARSGLSRTFLGSVTENVVRSAHCPVTTLHPTTELS